MDAPDNYHTVRLALGAGVAIGAFLVVFQPFGIDNGYGVDALWNAGYGALAALLLLVDDWILRPDWQLVARTGSSRRRSSLQQWARKLAFVGAGMVVYHGVLCGP